jgi:hypothetical protein
VVRCRCSRRCPAPCSAPASRPSRTAPTSLAAIGTAPHEHEGPSVLAHQWRRRVRPPPSPSFSLPPLPLFSSPVATSTGKGKTPSGLVRYPQEMGSIVGYTCSVKAAQGQKKPWHHGIGRPGEIGDVADLQWTPPRLSRHRHGQKGESPSGPASRWVGSGAVRLGVRACPPTDHPITRSARPVAGEKDEEEGRVRG